MMLCHRAPASKCDDKGLRRGEAGRLGQPRQNWLDASSWRCLREVHLIHHQS